MTNTKDMIAQAFLRIAKKKHLDKITVTELVEVCGITRQTFYYHFQDIVDVIEWILEKERNFLMAKALTASSLKEAIKIHLLSADEHSQLIGNLLESSRKEQVIDLFLNTIRSYLQEYTHRQNLLRDMTQSDIDTALTFYSYAITGVIIENKRKGRIDFDQQADQIIRLLQGQMFPREFIN